MLTLKVLTLSQWLLSHLFLVAGLVLVTIGLLQDEMTLNIIGIWVFVLGGCLGFTFAFRKVISK